MHKKPLVLITGGTSGLGKCLATIFIHQNKDLALIARKKDELTRVKEEFENINPNINLYIFDGNIADEEFVKYIYAFIEKKGYFPQYLINCAGIGEFGKADSSSKEMINRVFEANLVGLILMCSNALQHMYMKESYIVNILSTAALRGKANESVYCAAKWGARGYTEALKKAVQSTKIHILAVYPGGMNTNLWGKEKYNISKQNNYMNPQVVADKIVQKINSIKKDDDSDLIIERK